MYSYRHNETSCPHCGHHIDSATGPDGVAPRNGDLNVCLYCASVSVFKERNGKITIEFLTDEALDAINSDPELRKSLKKYQEATKNSNTYNFKK